MEVFTVEEFQEQFDDLMQRVENGETLGIVDKDGRASVMIPADDDFVRIHTDHNEAP